MKFLIKICISNMSSKFVNCYNHSLTYAHIELEENRLPKIRLINSFLELNLSQSAEDNANQSLKTISYIECLQCPLCTDFPHILSYLDWESVKHKD